MDDIVIELFLLSIGASFVQRTTGFGFGIFIMTMPPPSCPHTVRQQPSLASWR